MLSFVYTRTKYILRNISYNILKSFPVRTICYIIPLHDTLVGNNIQSGITQYIILNLFSSKVTYLSSCDSFKLLLCREILLFSRNICNVIKQRNKYSICMAHYLMKGKEIYNIRKNHLIVKTSWSSTNMVSIDDKYDLVVHGRRFGFCNKKGLRPS